MRYHHLILWDIKMQYKYGFYLMYSVFTILYVIILFALPISWRTYASAILILSDPAAMGLMFMGAIILLEKSQKVPCTLAVSPVNVMEYIFAKVISLLIIALLVSLIIAIASDAAWFDLPSILLGTALTNIIFTLIGIIIAARIQSLNQFILWTIPIECICFIPAVWHLFNQTPAILGYHPINVGMDLIAGNEIDLIGFGVLMIFMIALFMAARSSVLQMWKTAGGYKR